MHSSQQPPPLVLASASPRRKELLGFIGLQFSVQAADLDESVRPGEEPVAYVRRLAQEKAQSVALRNPEAWVLAADTTVVVDGAILGKPANEAEGAAMLQRLSGRKHHVHTGVAIVRPSTSPAATLGMNAPLASSINAPHASSISAPHASSINGPLASSINGPLASSINGPPASSINGALVVTTAVQFRLLRAEEIRWYVGTGEGRDKAGGYAVQGKAGAFITALEGSSTNVIGLPLAETCELLRELGFALPWSTA